MTLLSRWSSVRTAVTEEAARYGRGTTAPPPLEDAVGIGVARAGSVSVVGVPPGAVCAALAAVSRARKDPSSPMVLISGAGKTTVDGHARPHEGDHRRVRRRAIRSQGATWLQRLGPELAENPAT